MLTCPGTHNPQYCEEDHQTEDMCYYGKALRKCELLHDEDA
jgi:hypothetical protein